MKKFTIETPRFRDENELNIFLAHVADMREAQRRFNKIDSRFEQNCTDPEKVEVYRVAYEAKADLEKQIDDALKAMPPITALFF